MSRPLTVALLVAGCMTAVAGGSYLAVRPNEAAPVAGGAPAATSAPAAPASPVTGPGAAGPGVAGPVHETEGVIEAPKAAPPAPAPQLERAPEVTPDRPAPESRRRTVPAPARERRQPTVRAANSAATAIEAPPPPTDVPIGGHAGAGAVGGACGAAG